MTGVVESVLHNESFSEPKWMSCQAKWILALLRDVIVLLCCCVWSVAENEAANKMSLQNLATVFGPTVLRPAVKGSEVQTMEELFSSGTRDAMMQTSILMTFLNLRKKGAQFWAARCDYLVDQIVI